MQTGRSINADAREFHTKMAQSRICGNNANCAVNKRTVRTSIGLQIHQSVRRPWHDCAPGELLSFLEPLRIRPKETCHSLGAGRAVSITKDPSVVHDVEMGEDVGLQETQEAPRVDICRDNPQTKSSRTRMSVIVLELLPTPQDHSSRARARTLE